MKRRRNTEPALETGSGGGGANGSAVNGGANGSAVRRGSSGRVSFSIDEEDGGAGGRANGLRR